MRPEDRPCVTVVYDDASKGPGWTYWAHGGPFKEGDWVVVEAPRDQRAQLVEASGIPMLAKVIDTKPPGTMRKKATRWIVGKVEWDPYRALQALVPKTEGED